MTWARRWISQVRKTVNRHTWGDDDIAGLFDYLNGLVHIDLCVGANDLHGLPTGCGGGAVSTQDHIGQGAVHGLQG